MGDAESPGEVLLTLYERALPVVYGYLVDRCGDPATAEDLTSETFLAAVRVVRQSPDPAVSIPWLVGVARHKLVDHWRRRERGERVLAKSIALTDPPTDPWEAQLDSFRTASVLSALGGHHRAALTLRYIDGLSVPEVAAALGRTVHATEALLVRARGAFRDAYERGDDDG